MMDKRVRKRKDLLIWQVSPVHPGGQLQLNDPPPPILPFMPLVTTVVVTVQVPP